ncbi:hypothetical protein EJ08DRAFT_668802 [Tothia fuscella]|uniref:Uncharacterized protein n=1 Tax=Tothia fuscella TaxID=1048955 RepID=A0A9P4U216_9PEZI|nr:hypothetical protein EJ08DRAFT_668802 [Tothia fuscella]
MSLHRENSSELSMRRYDTFIYDGIMDHYRAEWVANPLRNPKTARVFAHFISATGPTLSIFERKPRNASAIFSETPVPNYQQGLWTYVLPMMALNHQGLLHAMLALASLHIAKLQNTSVTPSYKHYAYALKRIHHCVGNRAKRHMPTTIAATLLLGFYEVMTADHLKWSSHLAGAKQLFIEIDFKGMTKEYRRIKAEAAAQEPQNLYDDCETALQERNPNKTFKNLSLAIDESLVSTLIGRKLKYDQFGQIVEDTPNRQGPNESIPSALDTQKYELYQDLFWWYARQDVYQAIVSGNKLLLDYSRWADCPPRASMGRADAVHGTHDHLILLLGRIAEFQARDRSRKIKVMEANGGHWRPPANMDFGSPTLNRGAPLFPPAPGTSGPPGQGFGPPQGFTMGGGRGQMEPPGPPPQMPTFYGMAPSRSNAQMPSSYVIDGSNATPSPKSDRSDYDLENATQAALDEWFQIRAALNTFKSHFGPQFQPLSPELHQPTLTPFGPALQYRSYDVANLWGLYYMAYIIALRAHPHMPPAAMMAAGIAAQQTAEYTRLIGQIAGGIVPPHPGQALNPSLGASLCEISMPLFFAGVTYQHPGQRDWLVRHVRDIEARTGWASVGMIAQGCETAWIKAYEAGRGPPYQRTKEVWYVEESINDSRITRKGGHFDGVEPDPSDLSDKRWASTNAGTRVHWAMGLLSVEDDI